MSARPRLEQWFIADNDVLVGKIYGDSAFEDGSIIHTARVGKWVDGVAVTAEQSYELGEPLEGHSIRKY